MTSLKFVLKYLLLFFAIICAKSHRNTKQNTSIVNDLFKCKGWKNFKHVKSVTYLTNIYDLSSIIQDKISTDDCNKKVRVATIFLGCKYGYILEDIVNSVGYQRLFCGQITSNKSYKSQDHNCTEKLIELIFNITLFAKKLQGALYAIDNLHSIKWQLSTTKPKIIMKSVFEKFKNLQNQVNKYIALGDDLKDDKNIINTIKIYISRIKKELKFEINRYCKLELSINFLYIQILKNEYTNDINKCTKIFKSGSEIIISGIKELIIENFTNLVFEFNSKTEETFIPDSLCHLFEDDKPRE
ncbi:uncharacterized protein LOC126898725 [Daktulosphaira vitifoliae]|uniref:uncharacterized protein LOC126898725 n=1 Tax=Daktulosphaira vitifoliae TaxID=58002 RepID=UPI0021AA5312|nr:uncharacterized protein LOC126898725 [Daktulosphaira vitifoliae]